MSNKKVSVIIPVYNVEPYLEECVRSVMNQTLQDIEIICVYDKSTDRSGEILKRLAKQDSRIIVYESEKRAGLSGARNIGIRLACGEYIYYLDSDDYITPDAMETCYNVSRQKNLDILYFDTEHYIESDDLKTEQVLSFKGAYGFYTDEPVSGRQMLRFLNTKGNYLVSVWQQFYSAAFIRENNLYFEENIIAEDNLYTPLAMLYAKRTCSIPAVLHTYRRRHGSMTVEDSYLQKIAYSFAFIYNRNKEFLYELKGDEYYYDYYYLKVQTGRNLANRYKNIDSFDPAWKNHDKEIDTVLDLASLAYGGFFPLKLKRETLEQIRAAQNVVIYGAGKVGAGLLELLEERRVEVECFVTTTEPDTDTYRGKPVLKMSELSLNPKETIIVVAAAKDTDDMRAEALRCGYQNCISVYRWEAEWLGKPSEEEF